MKVVSGQAEFFQVRAARRAALIALAALALLPLGLPAAHARMREDRLWLVTRSGEHPIDIEIAESPEEKSLGLMFRKDLPPNRGMLFPYGAPQEITMWMRNTYIPLDMVFIRSDGVVHRIEERAEPLSDRHISSDGEVLAVLELAGGEARRLGLEPGDRVRHPLFNGKMR